MKCYFGFVVSPSKETCRNPSKSLGVSIDPKLLLWAEKRKNKFQVILGSNIAKDTRKSCMCPWIAQGTVSEQGGQTLTIGFHLSGLLLGHQPGTGGQREKQISKAKVQVYVSSNQRHLNLWFPCSVWLHGCSVLGGDLLLAGVITHSYEISVSEHAYSWFQKLVIWDYFLQIFVAWSPICCHHLG